MFKTFSFLGRSFVFGIAISIIYSCAGLHSVIALPSATLDQGNFKYVRYVEAEETAKYVFGIGGMSAQSRNINAYNKMIRKANLGPNQTVVNVSLRRNKHLYFPFGLVVTSITTIASGWVVEFLPNQTESNLPVRQDASPQDPVREETSSPEASKGTTVKLAREQLEEIDREIDNVAIPTASLTEIENGILKILDNTGQSLSKIQATKKEETNYMLAYNAVSTIGNLSRNGDIDRNTTIKNIKLLSVWIDRIPLSNSDREMLKNRIEILKTPLGAE